MAFSLSLPGAPEEDSFLPSLLSVVNFNDSLSFSSLSVEDFGDSFAFSSLSLVGLGDSFLLSLSRGDSFTFSGGGGAGGAASEVPGAPLVTSAPFEFSISMMSPSFVSPSDEPGGPPAPCSPAGSLALVPGAPSTPSPPGGSGGSGLPGGGRTGGRTVVELVRSKGGGVVVVIKVRGIGLVTGGIGVSGRSRSGRKPEWVDRGGTGVTKGVTDLCLSFSNSMTSSSVTGLAVD